MAGRRGAPLGRGPAAGRYTQHPGGGGGAGARLPRHQVRPCPPAAWLAWLGLWALAASPRFLLCGPGRAAASVSDGRFLREPGIINTISLLLPPRSPPPLPPGLANKQAVTGSLGQGGRWAGRRQEGPARQGAVGTQGHAWARWHGRTLSFLIRRPPPLPRGC